MNDTLVFILATLAVYRVSLIICMDEGPFSLFAKLRDRIDPAQATWYGRGLRCVVCVSFWTAIPATFLIGGSWLMWPGMAGAVAIIHKAVTK